MNELIKGLVEKVGLDEDKATQVVAFLKENASKLPALLGSAKDLAGDKLPDSVGGLFDS